jgi:oligoendopeptidase F
MRMSQPTLPPRGQIAPEHTWNSTNVFASPDAWAAELKQLSELIPTVQAKFQGHVSDSAATLADYFEQSSAILERVGKVYVYAAMSNAVDTTDQAALGMLSQAIGLLSQTAAAFAFANPELLEMGEAKLGGWLKSEPRLAQYEHYLDDLFRQQAHVRSAEVEEVLGLVGDVFGGVDNNANLLANADLKFAPATTRAGESVPLGQGNLDTFLAGSDREARRTAWENYMDGYLAFKNTFANNYLTAVKRDVFTARVRRYGSSLEAALFPFNIPTEVFYNLIDTYKKNLPTWHRYWKIRRRALGVEMLHPYDIWAPLTSTKPDVPYRQAVDWICEGLKPLGDDYVRVLRKGCLQDRWVDIYPNQGKQQGAFSGGWKGTFPFVMMSYDNDLGALSTLAHELGHSMHSYLTWKNQPMVYAQYSMFVAEVASNFNQAMTRAYLFEHNADNGFQIALIEEAMNNLHRYFFIMPTLARFEIDVHERIERGEGLTADDLIALMTDLFSEGYGGEMHIDPDRVGITWATFSHLYANFYVFQYATGISAAHALAAPILASTAGAAGKYIQFLSAGGSLYPLDALKLAGVDMRTPDAVEKTFEVLAEYVDRLDRLTRA